MSKYYLRKSALVLSLITAGLVANQVQADGQANPALNQNQTAASTPTEHATANQTSDQTSPLNQESPKTPEAASDGQTSKQIPDSNQDQDSKGSQASTSAEQAPNNQNQALAQNSTPQTANQTNPADLKPVEGEKVDVQILSTTDLHTNLVNYDYYQDKAAQNIGLAKTALLINQAEKENPNSVLVDNGDTIQGTPLGTYEALINPVKKGQQHPMYKAFTTLHYDAASLGNHEFNYGLDYLNQVIDAAGLPIVNANVLDAKTGKHYFNPYVIIPKTFTDTNGRQVTVNIGITGIVPPQIMNWDKANLEGKVKTIDAVQAVEAVAQEMRAQGADIVVVMSHSGIGDNDYVQGEENVGYQLASAKGIDAGVTGHAHAEFPSGNGTGIYKKIPGVDGVNYTFDVTQPNRYDSDGNLVNPDAHRVQDLTYQGEPVKDDQEFMVATNNYRASGNFPGVRNASLNQLLNLENRQVLINYITALKTVNPTADNNWHLADTIKGLDVHFRTAERAKNLLGNRSTIQFVAAGPSNNGFGDFKYIYSDQVSQASPVTPETQQVQGQETRGQTGLSLEERQAILQMVTENYQSLQNQTRRPTKTKTNQNAQLPKTNGQSSWGLSLIGLLISSLAVSLLPKSKRH